MGTRYLAITKIATKYYFFFKPDSCVDILVANIVAGLQIFLLVDDHESKGFRTFKVERASCSHSNTEPLAPISS